MARSLWLMLRHAPWRHALLACGLGLCIIARLWWWPKDAGWEQPPRCFSLAASVSSNAELVAPAVGACPRAVCVHPHPGAGLGHRLTNILQGALLADALGVLHAASTLEYAATPGFHGSYPGANDLFRMPEVAVADGNGSLAALRCPLSATDLPPGWGSACLTVPTEVRDGAADASVAVRLAAGAAAAACHTVYVAEEFWPPSYERVVPLLRAMYRPDSARGVALRAALRLNPARFNIALHMRSGDIEPTPASYFTGVVARILDELSPVIDQLPVDFWVFSESSTGAALLRGQVTDAIAAARAGGSPAANVRLRTEATDDFPLLAVLVHLLESDIFIGSDSSISWVVSWITTTTRAITPPRSPARGGGDHPGRRHHRKPVL